MLQSQLPVTRLKPNYNNDDDDDALNLYYNRYFKPVAHRTAVLNPSVYPTSQQHNCCIIW